MNAIHRTEPDPQRDRGGDGPDARDPAAGADARRGPGGPGTASGAAPATHGCGRRRIVSIWEK